MGRLRYSATVTRTKGLTRTSSAFRVSAILASTARGSRPATWTPFLRRGRKTRPSTPTRVVQESAGASQTETTIRSLGPILWVGRLLETDGSANPEGGAVCAQSAAARTVRNARNRMDMGNLPKL